MKFANWKLSLIKFVFRETVPVLIFRNNFDKISQQFCSIFPIIHHAYRYPKCPKYFKIREIYESIEIEVISCINLKRLFHEIFGLCFFRNQLPLGPWLTS
jgi:hypothetical protein